MNKPLESIAEREETAERQKKMRKNRSKATMDGGANKTETVRRPRTQAEAPGKKDPKGSQPPGGVPALELDQPSARTVVR